MSPQRPVRSEQRSQTAQSSLAFQVLRRFFTLQALLVDYRPPRVCALLAPWKDEKSAATRHGWVSGDPVQDTKWLSRGTATLLRQLSFARTGTLCWKIVSLTGQVTPHHTERAEARAEQHHRGAAIRDSERVEQGETSHEVLPTSAPKKITWIIGVGMSKCV